VGAKKIRTEETKEGKVLTDETPAFTELSARQASNTSRLWSVTAIAGLPLLKRRHVGAVQTRSRCDSPNFSVFSQPAPPWRVFRGQKSYRRGTFSKSIFRKCVVRIAVQPALAGLSGSDDGMTRPVRVFTCMAIGRAVAAQGDPAFLTRPQMHPVIADFHAFSALANFRLFDGCDRVEMRAGLVRHYKIPSSAWSSRERRDYPSDDEYCNSG
jgi:hypothetical protein